jgi:hypothetical protein
LSDDGGYNPRNGYVHIEPQGSAGLRLQFLRCSFGVVDFRKNVNTAFIEDLARFSRTDMTCRAVEKANAESVFDCLNVRGDRARRHIEGASRCRKAATVDYLHKRRHTKHAVHVIHQLCGEAEQFTIEFVT